MENLSKSQNAVISSITAFGKAHMHSADQIVIVRDIAYLESSLGTASLASKVGLFQYDVATWNQVFPGLDINSQNDQIAAMFSEVATYGKLYLDRLAAGDQMLQFYSGQEFIDACHHYHLSVNKNPTVTKAELDNAHTRSVKAKTALGQFRLVAAAPDYSDFPSGGGNAAYSQINNYSWQNYNINLPYGIVTVSDDVVYDSYGGLWNIP